MADSFSVKAVFELASSDAVPLAMGKSPFRTCFLTLRVFVPSVSIAYENGSYTHIGIFLVVLLLVVILDLLLDLLILDIVAVLDIQHTVNVDSGLELANHEVFLAIGFDALHREATNPRVRFARKLFRVCIAGLQVKGLLAVECEDLGGRQDTALVEDGQAGVFIGNIRSLLPSKLNGRLNHGLELLSSNHGGGIHVVHQGLDVDGGLLVSREDLLRLLSGSNGTGHGSAVSVDVNLVLALELLGQVVHEGLVKVSTTKVAVPGGSLDGQLTLLELDDGAGEVAVANVDEAHTAGLLLGSREVKLGDTPAKGSSSCVVHEAEDLEASNLGSIQKSSTLRVREPSRDTQAEVGNGQLQLVGSGLLDLAQVHGNKLGRRELLAVAEIVDLSANLTVDVDKGCGDILLLDLDIGIVEGAAGNTLEAIDGVLEVGNLLGLGRLAEVA
ncbi:hypothetical protein CFAM422_005585 [Trichoderma lentiforme]|uniref:Uncharacterized protein n=1 Tax=Trichoderma lentiforme TaxID=1567552 RepID=A0A9P4XHW5_9HYPO|nr:hypothetical protein CFAM422_005585 [Trichoderma lentiforme]